jgi:hypothetical protein
VTSKITHDLVNPSGLITLFFMTKLVVGPITRAFDRNSKRKEDKRWIVFNIVVEEENNKDIQQKWLVI